MPLLNPYDNVHGGQLPLPSTFAEPSSVSAACLCGARLPMQVRLGLKSRTRPVLEGRWACSDQCLQARVSSFVRRGLPQHPVPHVHRHRVPLGLLLLQSHSISQQQLQYALKAAEGSHARVGEVLVRDCGLPEQALAAALAQQWGCGSWDVRGLRPDVAACFAPRSLMERTGMLPVRELRDGRIGVAFADAVDTQIVFALQQIHHRPVNAGIAIASQYQAAFQRVRDVEGVRSMHLECGSQKDLVREIVRTLQKFQPVESRWARVHNVFWVRMWLESAALLGGLAQQEDIVDLTVQVPDGLLRGDEA